MIIGKGLIGHSLKLIDRESVLFFASGVSDSKSTSVEEYAREKKMILNYLGASDKLVRFVYFSTYSIEDPSNKNSAYVKHKEDIENIIKQSSKNYLIIRAPNLIGSIGNPKNVIRYFCNNIVMDVGFDLWKNAYRNILDIDHFIDMLKLVLEDERFLNKIIYLVNPNEYSVLEIVHSCEKILKKTAKYDIIDKGEQFFYDKSVSKQFFLDLNIKSENYLENVIEKYFLHNKSV